MKKDPPFTHRFDLSSVSRAGAKHHVEVPETALPGVAEWSKVDAVDGMSADIVIERKSAREFELEGRLHASIRQSCVVTLAPLQSRIDRAFVRRYRIGEDHREHKGGTAILDIDQTDEEVELLSTGWLDLAAPVLEELSLAIDPYKRAPGADFVSGEGNDAPEESPFAVLEKLKEKAPPPEKT